VGTRRRAREYAVQILFQLDVTGDDPDPVLATFWGRGRPTSEVVDFAEHLVRGTWAHRTEIDRILGESATHWRVSRMAIVDRNVLRLAVHELLHEEATPPAVILDEAIELAKRFGNADSGPFVNGVLDAIRLRMDGRSLANRLPPAE
jgi:transcription antitermination protein NusB